MSVNAEMLKYTAPFASKMPCIGRKYAAAEVYDEKQVGINGHAFTSRHQYTCGTNFDSVTLCRREKFSEKAAERVLLAGFALTKSALPAMLKILLEVAFL